MSTPKKPKQLRAVMPPPPNEPAAFTEVEGHAIQAMLAGTASEHQMRLGMQWIITCASAAHGQHFYSDDTHATAYALGKAFVGQQILGIARINLVNLENQPAKERK